MHKQKNSCIVHRRQWPIGPYMIFLLGRGRDYGGARLAGDSPGAREAREEAPRRRRFDPYASNYCGEKTGRLTICSAVNKNPIMDVQCHSYFGI